MHQWYHNVKNSSEQKIHRTSYRIKILCKRIVEFKKGACIIKYKHITRINKTIKINCSKHVTTQIKLSLKNNTVDNTRIQRWAMTFQRDKQTGQMILLWPLLGLIKLEPSKEHRYKGQTVGSKYSRNDMQSRKLERHRHLHRIQRNR